MNCKFTIFALSALLFAAVGIGCSGILPCDNQINLPSNIETIVNPKPIQRNFIQNNNTHKILVAVIDTGIDYNHPALMNSIHFCLDINHQPIGLGWDFIGQDRWPCPYIGRRTTLSKYELDLIDNLINEAAELKTYLDKRRNVVQECLASVWHGTSMAGLIVHDCRYIGLLAYRVVPPNTIPDGSQDYALHVIENITRACRYAIEDGAKIIVMTSFLHFDKTDDHLTYMRIKKLRDQFVNLMNSHNDVLFVASAGNCNGYRYSGQDLNQIDFPAGIIAENLLVVGSLSVEGHISSFSNIPTSNIKTVYFPGENKECICPQNMLSLPEEYLKTLPTMLNELLEGNESYRSLASYFRMLGTQKQMINDGTSFSAALAANACAKLWIENMKLTPSDIIKELTKEFDVALPEPCDEN
ncbi:MAG: S8 family serine peptidase [Desulfobacterales bacterium]|jgi:hypothetical protein